MNKITPQFAKNWVNSIKEPLKKSPQKIKKLTQEQRKFILNLIKRAKDSPEMSAEGFGDFRGSDIKTIEEDLTNVKGYAEVLKKHGGESPENLEKFSKEDFEELVKILDEGFQKVEKTTSDFVVKDIISDFRDDLQAYKIKAEAEKIKKMVSEESTQTETKSNFFTRTAKGIGNLLHLRVSSQKVEVALSDELK
jgi:hypothetical protein